MREYFLTSPRLAFSHWGPEDGRLAQALWGDPAVTRYICATGVFTPEEVDARLALEQENQARYGISYWPLFRRSDNVFVGCCGLRPHGEDETVLELGCHLCSGHWRQGYGMEAARAAIGYAFSTLGAKALFAGHNPHNAPSRGLLASLGFTYTGDEFYAPTGLYHPSYLLKREDV